MSFSKKLILLIPAIIIVSVIGILMVSLSQNPENNLPVTINDETKQDAGISQIIITSLKRTEDTSNLIVNGISHTSGSKDTKIVEVQLDDAEYTPATPKSAGDWSEWSVTLDTSRLDDGTHSIVARVIDNSGDEIFDDRSFSYNLNPITITNPPYDAIISGDSITITGTTDIGEEIKIVEVQLDDAEYTPATPKSAGDWSEWSVTLDTSTLDDGTHSIVARIIDNFEDEELDGISFNYTSGPIIITDPPYDAIISGDSITITGTTDIGEEIKIVEVQLDDSKFKPAIPIKTGDWSEWSVILDTSTLDDGTHSIVARVIDNFEDEEWDTKFLSYISSTGPLELHEEFSNDLYEMEPGNISPDGNWFAKWHDGGYLGVVEDFQDNANNVFVVESGSVDKITETKSAMILSSREYQNFKLSVDVRTDKQTRQNDPPNAWEVGWLVWAYNDPTHFNYFLLKSNGSEMGKYDGGVNPTHQKILFTNSLAQTSIGQWTNWEVIVQDSHLTILVDDIEVFDFDDFSSFDSGRIGFYLEDASVSFDNFTINPLS